MKYKCFCIKQFPCNIQVIMVSDVTPRWSRLLRKCLHYRNSFIENIDFCGFSFSCPVVYDTYIRIKIEIMIDTGGCLADANILPY